MIVRVQTGSSFKGAGLYLLHDKRLEGEAVRLTTERVPWTFAINTLEDEPHQVIAEMQQTALNQNMLKLMSGNRIDGRPTEKPVMTVSLSWSPDQQQPDREGMIDAARDYLAAMKWDGLEALIVPHTDEAHKHLHILLNRVDPVTGMTQDDAWRNHRSLLWAREHDAKEGFFLERREAKYTRGEQIGPEMTRREWEEWQRLGGAINNSGALYDASLKSGEWDALKAAQRDERKAFFKETISLQKDLREEIWGAVKAEFAGQWADYAERRDGLHVAQRQRDQETRRGISHLRRAGHGASSEGVARLQERQAEQYAAMKAELYDMRAPIIKAETARRAALAQPAFAAFERERDAAYKELLAAQRGEKAELKQDQAAGTRRPDLLQKQHDAAARLAEASQPRPALDRDEAPPGNPATPHPYRGTPRPAFGQSRAEAARRAHEHGSSPVFPADRPTPAGPPARTAADQLPGAAREATRPAPSIDMADFMNRRAAARAEERRNVKEASPKEISAAKAERQARDENRPKTDRQAFIEASRAQSRQRQAERGDDDGGRGRDR